jgi:retron-type reverse transcriptase
MINRESRNNLALALKQYVSGRISNDDLDDIEVDWRDRGALHIKEMAWLLYDDMKNHYAKGDFYLNKEARHEIAGWIVFLHSDLEYIWPEYSFIQINNWLMNFLTFGWWERMKQMKWNEFKEAGDFEVWPFINKTDLNRVMNNPRYLIGRRTC